MTFEVETIPNFEKEAKRLGKRFTSLNDDLLRLIEQLEQDPFIGTPLRSGFYKIRLAIKSKGKGKRAGARVITFVKVVKSRVFLVSIYDKSDQSDISDTELDALLSQIPDKK